MKNPNDRSTPFGKPSRMDRDMARPLEEPRSLVLASGGLWIADMRHLTVNRCVIGSVCLSTYLSVDLSIYLSVYLPI